MAYPAMTLSVAETTQPYYLQRFIVIGMMRLSERRIPRRRFRTDSSAISTLVRAYQGSFIQCRVYEPIRAQFSIRRSFYGRRPPHFMTLSVSVRSTGDFCSVDTASASSPGVHSTYTHNANTCKASS